MSDEQSRRWSPYQGLIPYEEGDADFFFGRDRDTRLIIANLFAAPLTLLYGPSGAGKSSVLEAGVVHQLRQREDVLIVSLRSWQGDPVEELKAAVADAAQRDFAESLSLPDSLSLADYLRDAGIQLGRNLMIILDQFEEYFLYHATEDGEGTFAFEFPQAIYASDMPLSFLISIREDALARLDRFEGRIPGLFDNYLRVNHLGRDAAHEAIERPIEQYNSTYAAEDRPPVTLEPELVEAVLDQVQTGQVVLGDVGRGVVRTGTSGATDVQIEAPYLQLVMVRLWDTEIGAGSHTMSLGTLDRLGGSESIVRNHLDGVMRRFSGGERDIAAGLFHYVVTPSGGKIAQTPYDLALYGGRALFKVEPVLTRLSEPQIRILRSTASGSGSQRARSYEIFHDALGPAVLDWRSRYLRAADRRRNWRIAVMWVLGILGLAGALAWSASLTVVDIAYVDSDQDAQAFAWSGNEYRFQGKQDRALQDFNEAIELYGQDSWIYVDRGNTYVDLGKFKNALIDFDVANRIRPSSHAHSSSGWVYLLLTKYDSAVLSSDKAVELDNKNALAFAVRGAAYRALGQYEKATADLDQAIALDPQDAFAFAVRGAVLAIQGEHERAKEDYESATMLTPLIARDYAVRALAYRLLDMAEEAKEDTERAVNLGLDRGLVNGVIENFLDEQIRLREQ